jgi:hypothetical protein
MAKSDEKKQAVKPEKPRNPEGGSPQSRSKGDGLAHDVAVIDVDPPDDLERNPGIGASKGTTMSGADADDVDDLFAEGDNSFPGDVENDAGLPGTGVDPKRRGRENK